MSPEMLTVSVMAVCDQLRAVFRDFESQNGPAHRERLDAAAYLAYSLGITTPNLPILGAAMMAYEQGQDDKQEVA